MTHSSVLRFSLQPSAWTYPLNSVHDTSDNFPIKNRSPDQIRLYLNTIHRVLADIAARVYKLAQMHLLVFFRNEADEMRPVAHFGTVFRRFSGGLSGSFFPFPHTTFQYYASTATMYFRASKKLRDVCSVPPQSISSSCGAAGVHETPPHR